MREKWLLILLVVLFSCNSHLDPEGVSNIDNYKLINSEVEETGIRREIYIFKNDMKYGFVRAYWPEGTIFRQSFMKDNLLHGISKTYTPDGKLDLTIEFRNNLKEGKVISYDAKGQIKNCQIYRQDKLTDEVCK